MAKQIALNFGSHFRGRNSKKSDMTSSCISCVFFKMSIFSVLSAAKTGKNISRLVCVENCTFLSEGQIMSYCLSVVPEGIRSNRRLLVATQSSMAAYINYFHWSGISIIYMDLKGIGVISALWLLKILRHTIIFISVGIIERDETISTHRQSAGFPVKHESACCSNSSCWGIRLWLNDLFLAESTDLFKVDGCHHQSFQMWHHSEKNMQNISLSFVCLLPFWCCLHEHNGKFSSKYDQHVHWIKKNGQCVCYF